MGSLLSYSGLTTKIRAMESRLLREDGYQKIAELTSVGEVVSFLKKEKAYQDVFYGVEEGGLRRGDVERLLKGAFREDFARLYRFSGQQQRVFLRMYFKQREIAMLKDCMRLAWDGVEPESRISQLKEFFRGHTVLPLEALSAVTSMEELAAVLAHCEYGVPLSRLAGRPGVTLFDYEMALDMYYFSYLWRNRGKLGDKKEVAAVTHAWGVRFDLINLNWICRSKQFYHVSAADIYAMLIPVHYRLKREEIAAMVEAPRIEDFAVLLGKTSYARKYRDLTVDTLEMMYDTILKSVLQREARNNPYSAAIVYSYLYQKEKEIDRLTTALECIRYRLGAAATYQHIMRQ